MSPRVLTARGQHSGKPDEDASVVSVVFGGDSEPAPEYPTCEHPVSEPRVRWLSNGTKRYVVQCLECGREMHHLKKSEWDLRELAEQNPNFDPDVSEEFYARYKARYDAWKARRDDARQSRRSAYMASNAWWSKRCLVLERDAYGCQARLPGCTRRADEVHHLTYNNLGNEPLWDLISVCTSCHEAVTAMNRRMRGTL